MSEKFHVDQEVVYVPNHAGGDPYHLDCERGIISTIKEQEDGSQKIWVRYKSPNGELTLTENLIPFAELDTDHNYWQ